MKGPLSNLRGACEDFDVTDYAFGQDQLEDKKRYIEAILYGNDEKEGVVNNRYFKAVQKINRTQQGSPVDFLAKAAKYMNGSGANPDVNKFYLQLMHEVSQDTEYVKTQAFEDDLNFLLVDRKIIQRSDLTAIRANPSEWFGKELEKLGVTTATITPQVRPEQVVHLSSQGPVLTATYEVPDVTKFVNALHSVNKLGKLHRDSHGSISTKPGMEKVWRSAETFLDESPYLKALKKIYIKDNPQESIEDEMLKYKMLKYATEGKGNINLEGRLLETLYEGKPQDFAAETTKMANGFRQGKEIHTEKKVTSTLSGKETSVKGPNGPVLKMHEDSRGRLTFDINTQARITIMAPMKIEDNGKLVYPGDPSKAPCQMITFEKGKVVSIINPPEGEMGGQQYKSSIDKAWLQTHQTYLKTQRSVHSPMAVASGPSPVPPGIGTQPIVYGHGRCM